ncbi:hypothetical protein [Mesonia sp. K4-1]|uniref:hypothetical protein n=1 Tax=Mesonia sp. K4-1 TaxID=2602760 RepID=UPI0011CB9376|nr:hypothetical protein [Mesonia sp. K4-1]TXK78703.1 hypothetical protein FT986_02600 [Mesonia sp. K4-1]
MSKRVSKEEKDKRVLTVQGWIIDGVQEDLMRRQIISEWGLSSKQAKRYIQAAFNNWKADEEINIELRRQAKIAELKQDLRSLKGEFKGTPQGLNAKARIQKMIIRLENIEPAKKHQVDANVTQTQLTREERDEMIQKLIEKATMNVNN